MEFEQFETAVKRRVAREIAEQVEYLRGRGLRYFEIFEIAKRADDSLEFAEFDSLVAEGD